MTRAVVEFVVMSKPEQKPDAEGAAGAPLSKPSNP